MNAYLFSEKGSAPASRLTLTLDVIPPFSDFPRRGSSARGGRAPQALH